MSLPIVDATLINNTNDTFYCPDCASLARCEPALGPGKSAQYACVGSDSASLHGHIDFTTSSSDGVVQLSIEYDFATGTLVPTPCNGGEQKYFVTPPSGTPDGDIVRGVFTISVPWVNQPPLLGG